MSLFILWEQQLNFEAQTLSVDSIVSSLIFSLVLLPRFLSLCCAHHCCIALAILNKPFSPPRRLDNICILSEGDLTVILPILPSCCYCWIDSFCSWDVAGKRETKFCWQIICLTEGRTWFELVPNATRVFSLNLATIDTKATSSYLWNSYPESEKCLSRK